MKTQKLITIVCSFFLIMALAVSCSKESEEVNETSAQKIKIDDSKKGDKVLYYAEWDEWGRAARECDGWGLCNFYDCWGCEVPPKTHGTIILDGSSDLYQMTIELNTNEADELIAINQQKPLYVDSNIVHDSLFDEWNTVTVPSGVYPFLSSVGSNGGYIINLRVE